MSYNVRDTFFGLVFAELGTTLDGFAREAMYVAFLEKFNVVSEYTIYACLVTDTTRVRAWIREYAEENL